MTKVVAHVDPGKGKVYKVPYASWAKARAITRSPHYRGARIVLKGEDGTVEVYERNRGKGKERMISRETRGEALMRKRMAR